jgi:hypothetical protein
MVCLGYNKLYSIIIFYSCYFRSFSPPKIEGVCPLKPLCHKNVLACSRDFNGDSSFTVRKFCRRRDATNNRVILIDRCNLLSSSFESTEQFIHSQFNDDKISNNCCLKAVFGTLFFFFSK